MEDTPSQKKSPYKSFDRLLMRVLPVLGAWVIRLLMSSCRVVEVRGYDRHNRAVMQSGGRAVYATWHQRMSYFFYYGGSRGMTIMVSKSRDGEYAARLASRLGFRCVRGSSTYGSIEALREIIGITRSGRITGMLADGPQGPARVAKIGALAIARAAKLPIMGVVWGADRCWVLNSWDRYMIPKPFARITLYFCPPIWVPQGTRGAEFEVCRRRLEEELNEGARWCDLFFGKERPWRKVTDHSTPEIGPIST